MRLFPTLLILTVAPGLVLAAKVEMPAWSEASDAGSYHLGGGLWPGGLVPEAPEEETETELADAAKENAPAKFYGPQGAVDGETPETELAATSRGGAEGEVGAVEEVIEEEPVPEPLPALEGDLADLYFEHPPIEFLLDPQRLLTEQKSNDIKRFLEFHSDEAEFNIYVMVLGETQTIPKDVNLRELHHEWFSENPTVLMVYYREQPEMTELVVNDSVRTSLPKSVFERIRQNCLREGAATDDAPDQVEKMAIELSIQLYWLGRLLEHENKDERERVAETSLQDLPASADAPELLREYAPGIFLSESKATVSLLVVGVVALGTLVVVGLTGWMIFWWRDRNNLAGRPLIFPNFEIVSRLGGEFSGGTYIGMSFDIGEGSS
ncbi:MAG: hypothetical protein WD342_16135 [Verrucomicrobiales bacterium]